MRYFVRFSEHHAVCLRRVVDRVLYELTPSGWAPIEDFDEAYRTVCTGDYTEIERVDHVPCLITRHRTWSSCNM